MKKEKMKKYVILLLIVLLLGLAVGYAAFSDVLTITGTANAKGTFDVKFTAYSLDENESAGIDFRNTTITPSNDDDTLTIVVKDLAYPGATAKFNTTIKNLGTVKAKVTGVTVTGGSENIEIIGLDQITTTDTLDPNEECRLGFYVRWKSDSEAQLATDEETTFSLTINYEQDTDVPNPTSTHAHQTFGG